MRALIVDPDAPNHIRLGEAAEPMPGPHEVVIEVTHASVNHGEVAMARHGAMSPGTVVGWDAAGVVVAEAADGGGPPVGARVVTRGPSGGWAERRAVRLDELAVLPDEVDPAVAAALPVAAGTALTALQASGSLLGRRVLITGASGGVGRFAVQLAALGGARVVAAVGSEEHRAGLPELGADQVVVGLDELDEPVDVVLDAVGGPVLVAAWGKLAPGGVLQSFGWASGEPATFEPYGTVGPAKSLCAFQEPDGLAPQLRVLVALVAEGRLRVDLGWRGPWDRLDEAVDAMFGRRLVGKAVMEITR